MKLSRVSSGSLMSAVSRVCSVSRPRCSSKSSPSAACAAAFFESTRRLVTSEMSDGSRWTCSGKRSIRRASSIFLSSRPLTSSPSFSCEVTTTQCLPRPFTPRLCTTACRSSIFWTSRATNWPTSSTTNIERCARAAGASSARWRARRACPGVMSALFLTAFTQESAIGYVVGLEAVHARGSPRCSANATLPFSASHSFSKSRRYSSSNCVEPALLLERRSRARRGRGPSRSRGSGGRART